MSPDQRLAALEAGNEKRYALAALRPQLHTGEVSLSGVFRDPPECVTHLLIPDLLLMGYRLGHVQLRRVGLLAVRDGVNLMVLVGSAGPATLEWVASTLEASTERTGRSSSPWRVAA